MEGQQAIYGEAVGVVSASRGDRDGTSAAISRCGVAAIGMEFDFRCISNRRGKGE